MKTTTARAIARLLLMLVIAPAAFASVNTPPLVAVDGSGGVAKFVATENLAATRNNHTATLLADGRVLVVGGFGESDALDSAELYDPSSGQWTHTGSLTSARYNHTATLLGNGKVLVTGGHGIDAPLDSSELYDPATGNWTATGKLTTARYYHTATLLGNGKVLVAAGFNYLNGDFLDSAELYDPTTGLWTATGHLAAARYVHTATLLANGKVLVAGGSDSSYLGSAELYDPGTGEWTGTGRLVDARYIHSATLLGNGKVLVAGGYGEAFFLNSAEIYDPVTGLWMGTGGLTDSRYSHTARLLGDGTVLVTGGIANSGSLKSSELYHPDSGLWSPTGSLAAARYNHTATLLGNGKVLVAGGYGDSGTLNSAEIFSPSAEITTATEGSLVTRTGTFSDADGNATVTLTASAGMIVQNNAAGTWSWTGTPADGPGNFNVTITATDSTGAEASTGFTFTVTNLPPTVVITAPTMADEDSLVEIAFTATDLSSVDQAAGFAWSISFGDGSVESPAVGTPSPRAFTHVFATPGDYTVTATATDKDGAVSLLVSKAITIRDVTPPVIAPHTNVGPIEATGPGGTTVVYAAATATDNSGQPPASISYSQNSGSVFAVGITTVTITAADAAANFSQSTFDVIVSDTTPPLASPPVDGFSPLTLGTTTLPDYTAQLLTSDLVGVTLVTQTPPAGTLMPAGTSPVTLVATDAADNQSAPVTFDVMVAATGLVNGSFENGYDGWIFSGNQSIQSGAPYSSTDGLKLVSFNDINRVANGVLSQTFPTTAGATYQLDFDMGVLAYNSSQQKLGVELVGRANLLTQSFTISSPSSRVLWENKSLRFVADGSTTTLVFRDLSPATVSIDLTLDHIRLTPLVTRTLAIASSPSVGAAITVSPPDNDAMANGVSNFTRRYLDGTTVSLTAPPVNNGFRFQKWLKNGVDLSSNTVVSFVVDRNLTLTAVYADSAPVITTQPSGGAVALGGTTTLSVTAEGTGTLTYQWRIGGIDIPGAHAAGYTISNMQPGDAGNYDVVVSNTIGPVTSEVATVSIVTNTLVNGSFEAGYEGWKFRGNQSLEQSAPYIATDGVRLVAFNGINSTPNGVLEQTFATTPGRSYTLDFDAGVLSYQTTSQVLKVAVNGTGTLLSRTLTLTGADGSIIRWFPLSFTFIANSSTSTLVFSDESAATNSVDLLLDHVSVHEGTVVPNTAPVAMDDSFMTTLNTTLVIPAPGVIANDSDADSSPLTVAINVQAQHGAVSLSPNGSFIYTPAAGFTGPDAFTYHANDGGLDSNIATVRLVVSPPSTQLLFNGSFEADFTGWVATGSQSIQSGAPYAATDGTRLASFNAGNRKPDAVLSQSIATIVGKSYTLAFDLGVLAYNTNTQTMQMMVSGTGSLLSQSVTLTGSGDGRNRWLSQSFTFVADSPVSTLTFRDQSTSTNAIDMMLDNVRVTGVSSLTLAVPASVSIVREVSAPSALATNPAQTEEMGAALLEGTPGNFIIRMTAMAAGVHVLERSGDLVSWEYVSEKSVAGPGFVEFQDTEPPEPSETKRFYRIGRRTSAP